MCPDIKSIPGERSNLQVQMDKIPYNLRIVTRYKDNRRRDRSLMAHTFLHGVTGWLLLSFYSTMSFKYKFVLIHLDGQAFLFFFLKGRLTERRIFWSLTAHAPTVILLSLSFIFLRSTYPNLSLQLEQKFHKRSDVEFPFSSLYPQHLE